MMDLSETGSQSEGSVSVGGEVAKKSCADCGTTKTPLWRGGPAGPKSLCNACGIRSRKKRRALLGLNQGGGTEEKKKIKKSTGSSNSMKRRMMELGREVQVQLQLQRSTVVEKQRKKMKMKMGEEEQAAVLLMALSYGSFCALVD